MTSVGEIVNSALFDFFWTTLEKSRVKDTDLTLEDTILDLGLIN